VAWVSASPAVGVVGNGASAQVTGVSATASPVAVTATAGGKSGSAQVSVAVPPTTIVFTSGAGSGRELWRMDPDGTNKVQLTFNSVGDYSPSLSPDGSQIAFVRDGVLYKMNADGTNPTPVVTAVGQVVTPAWSADGRIVYADFRGDFFTGKADLMVVTTAGVPERTLVAQGRYDVEPAWSPNASSVAFADGDSPLGCCDIWRVPATGTGGSLQLVFDAPGFAGTPDWSPDGTKIAFHSGFEVYVIDASGGTPTPLTPGTDGYRPSWSPDGTRIAYQGIPSGGTVADIWVMNADGSHKMNITNTPGIAEFQPTWGLQVGSPARAAVVDRRRERRSAPAAQPHRPLTPAARRAQEFASDLRDSATRPQQ
jgi:TolB protein